MDVKEKTGQEQLAERAKAGDSDALLVMALLTEFGAIDGKKDPAKAFQMQKEAAAKGNSAALLNLGLMSSRGIGTEVNQELAEKSLNFLAAKNKGGGWLKQTLKHLQKIKDIKGTSTKKLTKILVVDDSRTVRATLVATLTGLGYHIIEGTDGQDGLEKLKQNWDVKMVFLDVQMPHVDGLTMLDKLRKMPGCETLPVVMLTSESKVEMVKRAKELGVKGWLIKPAAAKDLELIARKFAPLPST